MAKQRRNRARKQARVAMEAAAGSGRPLTYTELTEKIDSLRLAPNSKVLAGFLCDLSREDDKKGKGLLSAVVVRADTDLPGKGFFELAIQRGRKMTSPEDAGERRAVWEDEIKHVYEAAGWRP